MWQGVRESFVFFNSFWLHWVFLAACRLSLVVESRSYSLVTVHWASHCGGFSFCRVWALRLTGFSSRGAWAQLPCSMGNLPRPGIKSSSPALTGGFSSIVQREKSKGSLDLQHLLISEVLKLYSSQQYDITEIWRKGKDAQQHTVAPYFDHTDRRDINNLKRIDSSKVVVK